MRLCLSGPSAIHFWRNYDNCIPGVAVFGHTLGAGPSLAEAFPSAFLPSFQRLDELDATRDLVAMCGLHRWGFCQGQLVHALVMRDHRRKSSEALMVHTCSGSLPERAVLAVEPGLCVASPEFAILQMAPHCSDLELLLLIQEFCGCYSIGRSGEGLRMRHPLTSVESIGRMASKAQGLKGLGRVRKVLPFAVDGSGSPRETALALLMCLPKRYGGFGVPAPRMNVALDLGGEAALLWEKRNAFDLVWEDARVVIEYDGRAAHATNEQRDRDNARRNAAAMRGYTVFVLTDERLRSLNQVYAIAKSLSKALGFRLVFQDDRFRERHLALRQVLLAC